MYFGNKSEGDMLVNMNAKIIKAISVFDRFQGATTYQIATPINAIM